MKIQRPPTRWARLRHRLGEGWMAARARLAYRLLGIAGGPTIFIDTKELLGFKTNIPFVELTITGNLTIRESNQWQHANGTLILCQQGDEA